MGVFADAGKNVEHFATQRRGVLHAVGREQRETVVLGEIDQLAVYPLFTAHEVPLQLDINLVRAKSVEQSSHAVSWLGSARVSRAGRAVPARQTFLHASLALKSSIIRKVRDSEDAVASTRDACATQQCDQPGGEFGQFFPPHRAVSLCAAQMRLGEEGAKVGVA